MSYQMQYRAVDERPLANEFRFRRVLGGSRVLQRTTQIHAIARSEPLSALQCQRRADVSRGRDLFRPGIGETPIFAEGSIRGMGGYGMTACVKVFGCRPHEGGAAHTGAGVRKPPMEETAGGADRSGVRRYGDFVAGGPLSKCIDRMFGKRSRGRRTRSVDRDRQNRRRAAKID